ncbi:hypothetical protein ABT026_22540 [Streptomyces sp. NPDC002734]|uniref:hypothetical protein n=1 Tax=Streptomyces sp. NPDC002734 TaxID=3154426 RepID=UPI00332785EB
MQRFKRNSLRAATMVGVAATCAVLGVGQAFAGTDVTVKSRVQLANGQSQLVATGIFLHDGDDWQICDNSADGDRAVIAVSWHTPDGDLRTSTTSNTGGAGTCVTAGYGVDIAEGQEVVVQVWHQDGADGMPQDIARGIGYA